ncbi:carbohydrate-binding protein [Vagococcus sp. WN89Y]|uniref:carbohydrate-binding protein n=1 Tax=Vagococcus sp. WN89Y TaxID=3457258 RepID=UPI003FCC554F
MLQPEVLASLKSTKNDSASAFIALPEKIVLGYWPNEPNTIGYKGGQATTLDLKDAPEGYNVVAVAFMKGAGVPGFTPHRWTPEAFRAQVGELNAQGRPVLLSLGGADAHIELALGQEEALAYEIIRLVETYGFDGFDIDLEQSAILAGDNPTVIPAALKMVKEHYASEGKHFIISLAPEFPHLREGASYQAYIQGLEGYYDLITPQYYNQGGDGVWIEEISRWITQNDEENKEDFLYYLTDSLIHGTRSYIQIPAQKLAIGLPANVDAANSGYVADPADVFNALQRLDAAGTPVRGIMSWAIDWDNSVNKDGVPYDWEFIKRYAHIGNDGDNGQHPTKPSAPASLRSPAQTENSITLSWNASTGDNPVVAYTLYRNNSDIGKTASLTYTDTGLNAGQQYAYRVVAIDSAGNVSDSSTSLFVSTPDPVVLTPAWVVNTWYVDGDVISYAGKNWRCVMQHTSNQYWTPDIAASLWEAV